MNDNPLIKMCRSCLRLRRAGDGKVKIQLLDAYGRVALKILEVEYEKSGEYSLKVNFPEIKRGIYYLNLISDDHTSVKKIIKL